MFDPPGNSAYRSGPIRLSLFWEVSPESVARAPAPPPPPPDPPKAISGCAALSNKFGFPLDPLVADFAKLRDDGMLTHISGMIFFLMDKYKGDKVRLRIKGNELVELAKLHDVSTEGLPKALAAQLAKAVSMQR